MTLKFEYNTQKSVANEKKHGINFETTQSIWKGPFVEFVAKSEFENRYASIGPIKGKLYTCIYTLRGKKIRIISCRRSRDKEVKLYGQAFKKTK